MQTIIAPLSGAQRFNNGFSLPPLAEDADDFNRQMYDLRALLRGGNEGGFEREISEQIRKTVPELRARGQYVPWQVFNRGEGSLSQRDMVAGTPSTGGSFIETQRLPQVVDALRPVSRIIESGATLLTDLSNNISIPRWQTPSSPSALTETAAAASGTQTTSLLTLTAHRISSMTVISRQLLTHTTNMGLEQLIKKEMLRSIGSAIDGFALSGTGAAGQPLGILNWPRNTPGQRDLGKTQPSIAFGGPVTWLEVNSFPASVEGTDIPDDGSFGWITSPAVKYKWANAPKIAGYPDYIYQNGKVGDNPLRASNNLPSNQVIFGRWSDCILALWPLSVLVDPMSQALSGNTRLFLDIFVDVGLLHAPAFCISADAGNQ
jgi:hypothetical protein